MKSIGRPLPAWVGSLTERFEPARILIRHAKLFVLVVCCILALTAVAYLSMSESYIATGTVLVGDPEPAVEQAPGDTLKVGDPADMESQLVIARSQSVMRRALNSAKAQEALRAECTAEGGEGFDGDCALLSNRMDKLVDYTSTRYSIGSVGRSRIINISYTSSQPQVASDMANALLDAFLEEQRETVSEGRESAATWLREETARLDAEIRALDKQITDYRAKNGLVRGASGPVNSERLTAISQQLAVAQAAQATANARLKEISDAGLGGSANATAVLESRTVGDLKQRITEVDAQLANAETSLGPAHPRLKAINDELRNLNGRLADEIRRVTQNAQKQYEAATERVALLTGQLDAAKAEVSTAAEGEVAIEGIIRQVEIKRQQYANLAGRVNQLEVDRRVRSGNVRLVSEAKVPFKPFFPKKVPFAAAGLTLGLLMGAVAAFLADKLSPAAVVASPRRNPTPAGNGPGNRSVSVPSQTRSGSKKGRRPAIRFSAVVPYLQAAAYGHGRHSARAVVDALVSDQDAREALDDFAWVVATGETGVRSGTVLLVTSASIGSGKTVTAAALARHLAAAGEKVLVIECNLARPLVADLLEVPVRSGQATNMPHDPVLKSAFVRLDVVPLGYAKLAMPRDNSSERRLADLLAWARKHYALVLLDGPSAASPDIRNLVNHADVVVVCATQEELESEATAAVISDILAVRQVEVGVVATMVDLEREKNPPLERMAENRSGR